MNNNPTIWLSYVSYPATTAAYFERALRKKYKVLTCGPQILQETLVQWDLQQMKAPISKHDISSGYQLDLKDALKQVHKDHHPHLFLWVESVYGFLPENIQNNGFPTACYLIDSHISLNDHLKWAKRFDYVFIAQREYIPEFKREGIENVFWLPLGCDPEVHSKHNVHKAYNVGFVGSLNGDLLRRRNQLLQKINSYTPVNYKRCFLEEMASFFTQSKIVFNNSIKNDLNMRLFEAMSTGSFLLTDIAKNSGQEDMFRDGEDYGIYNDDTIIEKVKYYLEHEDKREKIAKRGQSIVHRAHTYNLRLEELLKVSFGFKKNTPTAEEWRHMSEHDMKKSFPVTFIQSDSQQSQSNTKADRSFVIPVLDMSPASPYNIEKLLKELENIAGDVIIIFNSLDMAEKYKNNSRIDYYAIMKENVGVSRAWNIGINVSQTKVTFVMNADLSVQEDSINLMEHYLNILPEAAIVGPQGSFYSYEKAADIIYFDKGSFQHPFQVDAVSGFLFAVKTELFNSSVLKFDNQYTPCYFEEWDMGLQIKQANLKSYVVPVTGYEHEWSGSIRALRTIKYMKKEETAGEILKRNRELFHKKWDLITSLDGNDKICISIWRELLVQNAANLKASSKYEEAESVYKDILKVYPTDKEVLLKLAIVLKLQNKGKEADSYLKNVAEIETAKDSDSGTEHNIQNYYDNPRPDIQSMVDPGCKTILDVGCGSGTMGSELKKKLSAEVWGVELNQQAALKGKKNLDCILQGRIEDNLLLLPDGYFDCIIFADVIEHLVNPQEVLENIKEKLSAEGQIIISIPNVRFWNVIVNLLEGRWEYQDAGILDRTHLRFFTYSSALQLLQSSGYQVIGTIAAFSQDVKVPDQILEALKTTGLNIGNLKDEGSHFQYLIKCKKAPVC